MALCSQTLVLMPLLAMYFYNGVEFSADAAVLLPRVIHGGQYHPPTSSLDVIGRQFFAGPPRIMDPVSTIVLLMIVALGATVMFSFLTTAILAGFVTWANGLQPKSLDRKNLGPPLLDDLAFKVKEAIFRFY